MPEATELVSRVKIPDSALQALQLAENHVLAQWPNGESLLLPLFCLSAVEHSIAAPPVAEGCGGQRRPWPQLTPGFISTSCNVFRKWLFFSGVQLSDR